MRAHVCESDLPTGDKNIVAHASMIWYSVVQIKRKTQRNTSKYLKHKKASKSE